MDTQVVVHEVPIDAERDKLVQPRHQHPSSILAETQDLCGLGVEGVGELLGVEPVLEKRGVLPAHLVEDVVGVEIDGRDRDLAFRRRPCQHVRAKQDHVTGSDGLLTELAEDKRGAFPDDDNFHAVIRHRPYRVMHGLSPRQKRNVAPLLAAHQDASSKPTMAQSTAQDERTKRP
ncbi:hypothetical protein ACFPRL_06540 [Pseudoclavibacter helvolus]